MNKKFWAIVTIGLSIVMLAGCSTENNKSGQSSSSKTTKLSKADQALKNATTDVNSLFDVRYTELRDGLEKDEIDAVNKEVNSLSASKRSKLADNIKTAYKLWPAYAKSQSSKESSQAYKASMKADKVDAAKSSKEASSEANQTSKNIAAESSRDAASQSESSSKIAASTSKKKAQNQNKSISISMVKEMHDRIDGADGISEKVLALSKDPNANVDKIKKEIIVLKNVAAECDENYWSSDDYPDGFSDNLYKFWQLSSKILNAQRNYLRYLINETDKEPASFDKDVTKWNKLYTQIINS